MKSTSQPTWTAKGRRSPGTCAKSSAASPAVISAWCSTRSPSSAITAAFEQPSQLDMDRVNAQQARRFLDRVVGYMVSPLLWEKIARGLSAGRVQSVAVRCWSSGARDPRLRARGVLGTARRYPDAAKRGSCVSRLRREGDQAFRPGNRKRGRCGSVRELQQARFVTVGKREDKPTRTRRPRHSSPPRCNRRQHASGFFRQENHDLGAKRSTRPGFITYMRTDSTNLSQDAVRYAVSSMTPLASQLPAGKAQCLCQQVRRAGGPRSDPAIRRPYPAWHASSAMERDAERLYDLIWRQFVACQMPDAEYLSTTLLVVAGAYELRTAGGSRSLTVSYPCFAPVQKDEKT
jgi:DNA topoisomerase-1